jgi:predicted MFS family arabinose efflux permease
MTLAFTAESTMTFIFSSFFIVGVGMGFVALATLLVVQSGLDQRDLGVATSSNQFARTLGGAVGVGVCGGLVANRFSDLTKLVRDAGIVDGLLNVKGENRLGEIGELFSPEVQAAMPANLKQIVQETVSRGVGDVFWTATISAILCLLICLLLPQEGVSKAL